MRAGTAERDGGRVGALLAGLLAFVSLHLLYVATWDRLFAVAPWPGYEASARLGLVEPWFVNSPRSLWLTRVAFFVAALSLGIGRRGGRWRRATMLWGGAALGLVACYATTRMPSLPDGWLGFMLYPFRILLPIVLGTAIGELARRTLLRARGGAADAGAEAR